MAFLEATVPAITKPENTQTDQFRLVLFNDAGTHLLLSQAEGGYALPCLEIPKFTRQIEQITSRLRELWGFSTVVLWTEPIKTDQDIHYAVLELCKGNSQPPSGRYWLPIQNVRSQINEIDASFVKSSRDKAGNVILGVDSAPFSRLGWIYNIQNWVQSIVAPSGIRLGAFSQLSGSENTTLVRFETSGCPLWLKAVGQADPQEFANTRILSKLFPQFLPAILALDPLKKAWLMESGGETTLRHHQDLDNWKPVVLSLSALQVESRSRTIELLEVRCRDLRHATLAGLVPPFFEVIADLMKQQTKSSPPALTPVEVSELAVATREALNELSELGIPDTLGHGDFNPGNILIAGDHCAFIDWSAAHVGNPFLTLEYLAAHFRKNCAGSSGQSEVLRNAYADSWKPFVSSEKLARALNLTPLVATYAYAIASNSWQDPERLAWPGMPGYIRALARIMKRDNDLLKKRRVHA